jgi:hypothetical protein
VRFTGSSRDEVFTFAKPDSLQDENPDGSWMVDVQIQHVSAVRAASGNQSWWHLPRLNSGGVLRALFRQPARITRHDRFSVRVQNRESSLAQRMKPELKLELLSDSDLIRLFITDPYNKAWVVSDGRNELRCPERAVTGCRTSTKGAYLAGLIDLFGDFWTAKHFCERRFWRDLFNRLAGHGSGQDEKLSQKLVKLLKGHTNSTDPQQAVELADQVLYLVRGRLKGHYVRFRDCIQDRSRLEKQGLPEVLVYPQGRTVVQHHGARPVSFEEMKEGLDALIDLGLLRLGIESTCPRCKLESWHHVDNLCQHITCAGCGSKYALTATELWSYALNSLAQMCVSQGAIAVLLALTALGSRARSFFAFSPSLDLFRSGNTQVWHEVDILCIVDGEFVIGEVKSGSVGKKTFDELAEIAEALRPQRAIIFLPLESAIGQQANLETWLQELQSKVGAHGISAEIFTLPAY